MITVVVPRELEAELFEGLVEHHRDNPHVQVIVDRRTGPDRRRDSSYGGQRILRDRRRARVPGSFLPLYTPDAP
jgi:hypothetical protein